MTSYPYGDNPSADGERLPAINGFPAITAPHGAAWRPVRPGTDERAADAASAAVRAAVEKLMAPHNYPIGSEGLALDRDSLGKPFVLWFGDVAEWASRAGFASEHLHISNTHDGEAHIVIAAYSPALCGIGIDAVYLPRLRTPGRDREYLFRFAGKFMSEEERVCFATADDAPFGVVADEVEAIRLRVAAHFSLMEAASKACGTGLKIGAGMGKSTSLSKQSLGVRRLTPDVRLLFGPEAEERLAVMGAARHEAGLAIAGDFLITAVALYRDR